MKIQINVYHTHSYPEYDAMSEQLEAIRREVAEAKTAQQSAIVLIDGLKTQLDSIVANATELTELKAELAALSIDLSDSTDALAAAVATPPATDPTP